jgi:hypothetical protein
MGAATGNCAIRKVVTKDFCGEVVILDFRSELKNDYRRWFKGTLERAQSEAKISKEVVKRGLAKGLGNEKNDVKGSLERMGEEKFKRGTI